MKKTNKTFKAIFKVDTVIFISKMVCNLVWAEFSAACCIIMRRDMAISKQKPMDFALKMLAIRDYGEAELRLRMEGKGFPKGDTDHVIAYLKEKNLINDGVYISKIIEKYTLKAPSGKAFIKDYLEKKGIKKEEFEAFLEPVNELSTARLAFKLKFKPLKDMEKPSKIRQKAANYLQTKGFDYDIIVEILNEEIKGDPDYE